MELVYLWVEEYKNIKKQGFNFSPKHKFELKEENGKYILEDKKTEEERERIPDNFFEDNINNVTAIVGKNGSGKSSLVEILFNLIRNPTFPFREVEDTRTVLIFKNEKNDYLFFSNTYKFSKKKFFLRKPDGTFNKLERTSLIDLSFIFYDNIILRKSMRNKGKELERFDISSEALLNEHQGNKESFEASEIKRDLYYLKDYNTFIRTKSMMEINLPKFVYLDMPGGTNPSDLDEFNEKLLKRIVLEIFHGIGERTTTEIFFNVCYSGVTLEDLLKNEEVKKVKIIEAIKEYEGNFQEELPDKDNIIKRVDSYISIYKILEEGITSYQEGPIKEKYQNFIKSNKISKIKELDEKFFKEIDSEILSKNRKANSVCKYFDFAKNFYKFILRGKIRGTTRKIKDGRIEIELGGKSIVDIARFLRDYINNPLENEMINYSFEIEMSSGEKALLRMFSRFYSIVQKIKFENVLIIMDEAEMFMHPEWQRLFIDTFVKFISKTFKDKNIQVILTSHSPFMASDLPKENVIMLDTYSENGREVQTKEQKIGNCKISRSEKRTFGANIFDLYKDSFFLKSTFGEFGKQKIKDVIWLLTKETIEINSEKLERYNLDSDDKLKERYKKEEITEEFRTSKKKEIEYIVESVGEKLIKARLEKMWEEYNLDKKKEDNVAKIKWIMENYGISGDDVKSAFGVVSND